MEKKVINFIRQSNYVIVIFALMLIGSIASLLTKGLNYGIDFKGGILIEVKTTEQIDITQMRQKIGTLGFEEVKLQELGNAGNEMMIHVSGGENEAEQKVVIEKIKATLSPDTQYNRIDVVGPKIGKELTKQSWIASIIALIAIALYITFRFEWQFAFVCLISVAFDLLVTLGLFSITGLDFNMTVVAGILSLAGYTTNDKVVNFDRIRENLKIYRKMKLVDLLNKSLTDTLSRTLLTSITTMLVLVVLIFIGGETLIGFAICLLYGIVIGTFSSIYLAVPLLRFFNISTIGAKAVETGPYAEAAKYEMQAKQQPLGPYRKRR